MTHAGTCIWATAIGMVALLEAPAAAVPAGAYTYPAPGSVYYAITRDGDQIGSYEMNFSRDGKRFEVRTRTDIAVSFLGIVVYRLDSSSEELWIDGRLQIFHVKSDDDGMAREVLVRARAADFEVVENGVAHSVSGNPLPGTLWHPATLTATELIDPIDGKSGKVRVTDRGMEQIIVQGKSMRAHHVSILQQRSLEVWYAADGRILAMSYRAWDNSLIVTELR
jgi:hypothetical protein